MKYAIEIWLFGIALTILLTVNDYDSTTIKEKIEFILWFGCVYSLAITAAILFAGA